MRRAAKTRLGLLGEKPMGSILATMRPASSGGSISTSIGNFVYSSRAPQKLGCAIGEARNQQPSIQDRGEPFLFGAHGTGEAWCEGAPFQTSCFFLCLIFLCQVPSQKLIGGPLLDAAFTHHKAKFARTVRSPPPLALVCVCVCVFLHSSWANCAPYQLILGHPQRW